MKEKEETDVSEQVGVSRFPVPHAAGREAGEALMDSSRLYTTPVIGDERSPPFLPKISAAQCLSLPSCCCVPVIPSASLS